MFISTILLIANLVALILNGNVLFSFWWLLLTYPLEILIEVLVYLCVLIPFGLLKAAVEAIK